MIKIWTLSRVEQHHRNTCNKTRGAEHLGHSDSGEFERHCAGLRIRSGGPGGARELHRLALIWVHEPLTPFDPPVLRQPTFILTWPEGRVSTEAVEQALKTRLHAPLYDDETGTLIGVQPLSLSPSEQWLD